MSRDNRIEIIIGAKNQTDSAFKGALTGLAAFGAKITAIAGAFSVVDYAARRAFAMVADAIEPAYMAVEDFELRVAKLAALLSGMMPGPDLAANYREAKQYAEALIPVLEEIDAKTIAGAEDLSIIVEEMAKQGVVLDVNNAKAVQGFQNIANAIATVSAGSANRMVQMRQEIRAILAGTTRNTDQLSQQLDAMLDGQLSRMVETWKQQGTLVENLGDALGGYQAASDDLENTWAAIGTSIETIATIILRSGFREAYQEINGYLKEWVEWTREHSNQIGGVVKRGWLTVKGLIETIFNIFRGWGGEALRSILFVVGEIAKGWGLIAYAVLPVIAEKIGQLINLVWEFLGILTNSVGIIIDALTLDFDAVKFNAAKVRERYTKIGALVGEFWGEGFVAETEKVFGKIGDRAMYFLKDPTSSTDKPNKPATKTPKPSDKVINEQVQGIDNIASGDVAAIRAAEAGRQAAYRTRLANLELNFQAMLISEQTYILQSDRLKQEALQSTITALAEERKVVEAAGNRKIALITDEADRLTAQTRLKNTILGIDTQIARVQEQIAQTGVATKLAELKYTRELSKEQADGILANLKAEIELIKERNAIAVETGDLAPIEAARIELDLDRQLIETKITLLQADLDRTAQDAERARILRQIAVLQARLNVLLADQAQLLRESGDAGDGFRQGMKRFMTDVADEFSFGLAMAGQFASGMYGAFKSSFLDIMHGEFDNLLDHFISVLEQMVAEIIARKVFLSLFGDGTKAGGFMSSLFGGAASAGGGAAETAAGVAGAAAQGAATDPAGAKTGDAGGDAKSGGMFGWGGVAMMGLTALNSWRATRESPKINYYHGGGLVVPSFHSGGLAADETPAILQLGERVLDREQNKMFEKLARSDQPASSNVDITVPITIDTSNKQLATDLRESIEETVHRTLQRYANA